MSVGVCAWAAFDNTNVAGGVAQRDQTIEDCQRTCINTIYCVGIDIDPNPQSSYCWLTILPDASGPMQPFNGVTHYILTRQAGCPYEGEDCSNINNNKESICDTIRYDTAIALKN